MGKIALLDRHSIDQINAGEVLENPASAVKELIENALDANARHIRIEIQAAGRVLLSVKDDGDGMDKEDLGLCCLPHATSKIRSASELNDIQTFGFRGEALAAIGAVAKLGITSGDGTDAWAINCEGGKLGQCHRASHGKGTSVVVRDLFFNQPVRLGFLKSLSADNAAISRVVYDAALANPRVGFSYTNDGQDKLSVAAEQTLSLPEALFERALAILGGDFCNNARPFETEAGFGLLGDPSAAHKTRSGQYISLNGRPLVSKELLQAVSIGYGTRLSPRSFPQCVLNAFLPPADIDVNVHPQKLQIRFRNASAVISSLSRSIDKALTRAIAPPLFVPAAFSPSTEASFHSTATSDAEPLYQASLFPKEVSAELSWQFLGFFGPYIVATRAENLICVDPQRAQWRLFFDHFSSSSSSQALGSQKLLFPTPLTLSEEESAKCIELLPLFEHLGFELRIFGPTSFLCEATPPNLDVSHIASLIRDTIHDKGPATQKQRSLYKRCAKACSQPIQHKDAAVLILKQIKHLNLNTRTPDSEPIFWSLSLSELLQNLSR